MGLTIADLCEYMEKLAPLRYAQSYDNPGLLIGRPERPLHTVMLSVDASWSVISQAEQAKADLLLVHHPLIFHPLQKVTPDDEVGARVLELAEKGIALYSAHTNLDSAPAGNIDRAAEALGLSNIQAVAENDQSPACLRTGIPASGSMPLGQLAALCRKVFHTSEVRMYGDAKRLVRKAGLVTGSGMDFAGLCLREGCDVLITGDVTYHKAQSALAEGMAVIDATHFATDRFGLQWLRDELILHFSKDISDPLAVLTAQESDLFVPV